MAATYITQTNMMPATNSLSFRPLYEAIARAIFKLYFRLVHHITVEGRENVPKNPDKLIVIANHESLLDGLILWTYLDWNSR